MSPGIGFDSDLYLREQSAAIVERLARFGGRLYLEFGGKLVFDHHAARILPGYDPNAKIRLLQTLGDRAEIVLCIHAGDIERRKMRADFGITYDIDTLRLIDDLRARQLCMAGVVITRFDGQPSAEQFRNRLERRGIRTYMHGKTKGYPTDIDRIVSAQGYGVNACIETRKPIVVVAGPGPGSGKMATCLSQMYHDHLRGVSSGYAKFETFPIWNLTLKHPVNVAYEAATADIGDVNVVDAYHLEAHGESAVNYNRDMEVFPVLKRILLRMGKTDATYASPTDMGVNRVGAAIVDDAAVREAAVQEVLRRMFRYRCEYAMGIASADTVERVALLTESLGVTPEHRRVVRPARRAASEGPGLGKGNQGVYCGAALELRDATVITACNSERMHAASAVVLNAVKHLARIPREMDVLTGHTIESIAELKGEILNARQLSLNLDETLIALSVSATHNPAARIAMQKLRELRGCEMHVTHIPPPGDEAGLRRLGVNLTSDPAFAGNNLYTL